MKMPDATIAPSGDRRFTAALLMIGACLLAAACTQEVPQQAALGDEIAVGPYVLSVLRARPAPTPPPPISTFRRQPGKKAIVVIVYWKTLEGDMDVMRRLAFVESFLGRQLSITDADNARTKPLHSMQERIMYMQDAGANWRDWAVVFHVPAESRNLTLLVENPEPREGQARRTAIPLGM